MIQETCAICAHAKLTASRTITCTSCEFKCCRSCVEKYLCSTQDDPNCMACKALISRDALASIMTKAFMTGPYKEHRGQQLYQRELALMPSTQPYVEQELARRENATALAEALAHRDSLKRKLREADEYCAQLRQNVTPPIVQADRRAFVHKCAASDCNGFLSTAWRCLVCSKKTCSECGALQTDGHICEEANRSSFQLIKRDSRRCPGCAEYIFKVSGCDQMFCTACHTSFSWLTGRKVNGQLHNPHYIEWQRKTGGVTRNLGDIPCGGRPHVQEVIRTFASTRHDPAVRWLIAVVGVLNHIEDVEYRRYHANRIDENVHLRVKYVMNEIDEASLKVELQRHEKTTEKKRCIHLVLEMLVNTASDLLRQIIQSPSRMPELHCELSRLIRYTNQEMRNVSKRYQCVVPLVGCTDDSAMLVHVRA